MKEEFQVDRFKGMLLGAVLLLALVIGGATIAAAAGSDDPQSSAPATQDGDSRDDDEGEDEADDDAGEVDEQVTGPRADDAGAAALEATGGGTVTEVEVADEGDSGYEVEVKREDGSFVEVALDNDFNVVSVENDDD